MKFRALCVLFAAPLIVALATASASAQSSTPTPMALPPVITGNYTFSGANADGSNPYTGTLAITGSSSIYTLVYTQGSTQPVTSIGLLTGDVLFAVSGDPSCDNTVYVPYTDGSGTLLGKWIDPANANGLGIDVLTPSAKTTSFVGSYRDIGLDGAGNSYGGTATIAAGSGGLYNVEYDYPATPTYAAYAIKGYGLAQGNVLGISVSSDPTISADKCNLYMIEFEKDGSYKGAFEMAGTVGTETGKRAS